MKNDEAALPGRPDNNSTRAVNDSALMLIAAPSVEIRIALEDCPVVRYYARTAEDAERLRIWLAGRPDLVALIVGFAEFVGGVVEGPPGGADWTLRDVA